MGKNGHVCEVVCTHHSVLLLLFCHPNKVLSFLVSNEVAQTPGRICFKTQIYNRHISLRSLNNVVALLHNIFIELLAPREIKLINKMTEANDTQ